MAQVRAALRAYAVEDDGPLPVVERLAHLVDRFDVAGLVTVVYGVLGAPTSGGARQFDWANAGHPSPLVVLPNGQVQELGEGRSRVIGAPGSEPRDQGRALLSAGSFLLLYTDGLVERPGTDLSVSTSQLRSCLEQQPPGRSANELCAAVLAAKPIDQTRDDIAMVIIRLLPAVVTEGVSLRLDHPAEAAAVSGPVPAASGVVPAARQRKAPSGQRALAELPIVLDSDVAYDVVPPLVVLDRQRVGKGVDDGEPTARLIWASGTTEPAWLPAGLLTNSDHFDRDTGGVRGEKNLDVATAGVDDAIAHQFGDDH